MYEKIEKARVGIAGLGGLGSNVAVSLARLGIGNLFLVDFDEVEASNLNRQQYFIEHIGIKKTEALKDVLKKINKDIKIETKNMYLDKSNIEDCFKDVDIIVEAFDNSRCKAEIVNTVLVKMPEKYIVSASGMAGYLPSNTIKTRKITDKFYLVGDGVSEVKEGYKLMAPRVAIAANHEANAVLRIILGEKNI